MLTLIYNKFLLIIKFLNIFYKTIYRIIRIIPQKKITVVDIKDDENADIVVDSNEVTIPEMQPIIEENSIGTQEKPIVEDTPVEEKPVEDKPVEDKPIVEEKIIRTNELIKCPKCLKMVTNKTLKYSHKKTCTGEDKPEPISKSKPISKQLAKIEEEEEEVPPSPPKLVRTISLVTPVTQQLTPEMMRTYRNEMRTQQLKIRSDRMSSLFTNSI